MRRIYLLLSLAALASNCRHSDNSSDVKELGITYRRTTPLVIPLISGCFEVTLIKTGNAIAADGQNYFDNSNCEFIGEDSNSAGSVHSNWLSAAGINDRTGFRKGCLAAFAAAPDPRPRFKYILRVSDVATANSKAELRATYSLKTVPMTPPAIFPERSGVTGYIIEAKEDVMQGTALVQISPNDSSSMKIFLEKSGASGIHSPMVFHYDSKSSAILKYLGHVPSNLQCD